MPAVAAASHAPAPDRTDALASCAGVVDPPPRARTRRSFHPLLSGCGERPKSSKGPSSGRDRGPRLKSRRAPVRPVARNRCRSPRRGSGPVRTQFLARSHSRCGVPNSSQAQKRGAQPHRATPARSRSSAPTRNAARRLSPSGHSGTCASRSRWIQHFRETHHFNHPANHQPRVADFDPRHAVAPVHP